MKICLIPLKTEIRNPIQNMHELERRLVECLEYHPDLICLPELTLTGYLYSPDDLSKFAETVTGVTVTKVGEIARRNSVNICFGIIEREGEDYFNTAVLIDRNGELVSCYRKISEKPPFTPGQTLSSTIIDSINFRLIICGDLFDERIYEIPNDSCGFQIVLMARSFDNKSPDIYRWENEEKAEYLKVVKQTGITTGIVNALDVNCDSHSFGGSLIVNADGELLAESQHGSDHLLFWEICNNDLVNSN